MPIRKPKLGRRSWLIIRRSMTLRKTMPFQFTVPNRTDAIVEGNSETDHHRVNLMIHKKLMMKIETLLRAPWTRLGRSLLEKLLHVQMKSSKTTRRCHTRWTRCSKKFNLWRLSKVLKAKATLLNQKVLTKTILSERNADAVVFTEESAKRKAKVEQLMRIPTSLWVWTLQPKGTRRLQRKASTAMIRAQPRRRRTRPQSVCSSQRLIKADVDREDSQEREV